MNRLKNVRSQFDFQAIRWKEMTRWFPGHMHKGMKDLEKLLSQVDGIIEVHDSRIPHSGRNSQLYQRLVGGQKPHILLLNKVDLTDPKYIDQSVKYIQSQQNNVEVIHSSLHKADLKEISDIFGRLLRQIIESPRYTRNATPEYNIIICGIPNVGKSTLINKLRNFFVNKPNSERVGASPGVTKNMSEKVKISMRPKVFVRDTPGILEPRLRSPDESFRLLLTNCIPLQQRDLSDIVADYALFLLNKYEKQDLYTKYCGLEQTTDDISTLLMSLAKAKNCMQVFSGKRGYDLTGAALHFLNKLEEGTFGQINFDQDILDKLKNESMTDNNFFRINSDQIKRSI